MKISTKYLLLLSFAALCHAGGMNAMDDNKNNPTQLEIQLGRLDLISRFDSVTRRNILIQALPLWDPIANPEIEDELDLQVAHLPRLDQTIVWDEISKRKEQAKTQKAADDLTAAQKADTDLKNSISYKIKAFAWDGNRKIATLSFIAFVSAVGLYIKYKGEELNLGGRINAAKNYLRIKLGLEKKQRLA